MPNEPEIAMIIEAALLQGATRAVVEAEIARRAIATGMTAPEPKDIDAAYAKILDRWVAEANQDEEIAFAYHVRMRKHLYLKSFSLNDFKTCLAIASDLAKLEDQHRERKERTEMIKRADVVMGCAYRECNGEKKS
jgi:hypothetical protein